MFHIIGYLEHNFAPFFFHNSIEVGKFEKLVSDIFLTLFVVSSLRLNMTMDKPKGKRI